MKNNLFIAVICLVLGIAALTVGIVEENKQGEWKKATGTIFSVSEESGYDIDNNLFTNYMVFVSYEADGEPCLGELNYFEDGFTEGKKLDILYNPQNTSEIAVASRTFSIYLIIIGPVLMALSLFMLFKGIFRKKKAMSR